MQTPLGHLTFCTNIFPGETWEEHFEALKENIPLIKSELSPDRPFGIGLRLSNKASLQLSKEESLKAFQIWLQENNCHVLAINGFPYGNFHGARVKDKVHFPDWASNDRLQYTLRISRILAALLPEGMEGGVSTSPLSYKHWFTDDEGQLEYTVEKATWNIIEVVCLLLGIYKNTGKILHLDMEPEADGLIESSTEFINWFQHQLIPLGIDILQDRMALTEKEAENALREHVRLCYDVCHFAVGFETVIPVLEKLKKADIKIGRWQLSAALKAPLPVDNERRIHTIKELEEFNEPVYLHQVVTRQTDGSLSRYADLPDAINDEKAGKAEEWRSHFHVPLFVRDYGLLQSTQDEVARAIAAQKDERQCNILEVETYTWEVLPGDLKLPLAESIIREMKWVLNEMNRE